MRPLSLTVLLFGLLSPLGLAQTEASPDHSAQAQVRDAPVLVELFTSQSCSSCPKAEQIFAELAERDDLVVIQWHVDYWDILVHGRDGRWKDPYSSAANTERQRDYNYAMRGRASVYTPQAIVAGVSEVTGSRRQRLENMIDDAPASYAKIDMVHDETGLRVAVSTKAGVTPSQANEMKGAEVMMVEMIASASNKILGGENRGLTAYSRNVAISHDTLGAWTGQAETYRARTVDASHNCAVIVQEQGTGRILGASYCPSVSDPADSLTATRNDFISGHP